MGLEIRRLKILIHDFAGHTFQVALSRELADRGHEVTHAFFAGDPGPKGAMRDYRSGNGSVYMRPLSVGRPYVKGNFIRRLLLDLRYRGVLADTIRGSLTSSYRAIRDLDSRPGPFRCSPNWRVLYLLVPRFYSIAVGSIFRKKLGALGYLIRRCLFIWDKRQVINSDHIINITSTFTSLCRSGAIPLGQSDK